MCEDVDDLLVGGTRHRVDGEVSKETGSVWSVAHATPRRRIKTGGVANSCDLLLRQVNSIVHDSGVEVVLNESESSLRSILIDSWKVKVVDEEHD
jgi:hypothetical protein